MKYMILYFSGTGNTELIANEIKNRLVDANHSVELISVEDEKGIAEIDFKDKIIGFGYPVYKFSYPDIFNRFISKFNKMSIGNKYFQFSTYARFDAQAFCDFSKKLDGNKFQLITQKSFKAPSCGIAARKSADDYEYKSVMFFEDGIAESLDKFVQEIMKAKTQEVKQKCGVLNGLKKTIVQDIEITKYPTLQINADSCCVCGLCAQKCPENNLQKENTYMEVVDKQGCLHCLRCMNRCPKNAISFGELTEGSNQYTLKIRDELFEKSLGGYKEMYWNDFDDVVRKWRKNTIKYWIGKKLRKR